MIEVMRPSGPSGRPIASLEGSHIFDTKVDGVRLVITHTTDGTSIRTRHGNELSRSFPDILPPPLDVPAIIDAELYVSDLRSTFRRCATTTSALVARAVVQNPAHVVAFDLLSLDGEDLRHEPYSVRRSMLERLGSEWRSPYTLSVVSRSSDLFDAVKGRCEGVVAKRLDSPYTGGTSVNWVKYKHFPTASMVVVGLTPKGVRVAVLDGTKVVPLGVVTSGITKLDVQDLRRLESIGDPFVVEVQYTSFSNGKLGHPVYRGLRADVLQEECRLEQLLDPQTTG